MAQPSLMHTLRLGVNEDIRGRITYSVTVPRLNPDDMGAFKWTRAQIRAARQRPLQPLLEQLGYRLQPAGADNFTVLGLPDEVVIKHHYWVRLDDGASGNAIDFLITIRGLSFSQAMRTLCEQPAPS